MYVTSMTIIVLGVWSGSAGLQKSFISVKL